MLDASLKATLVKKYPTEQVFIVPFEQTKRIPDGFTPAQNLKVSLGSWGAKGRFIFRHDAEYNPTVQQLIPYIMVLNQNGSKVYVTERIAGEERLKGNLALGCGGHINPVDSNDVILDAATREMNEELEVKGAKPFIHYGYIRDMKSETNDHMGIVLITYAKSASVKETESLKGYWMPLSELIAKYSKFESWAKLIIDHLYTNHKLDKILI